VNTAPVAAARRRRPRLNDLPAPGMLFGRGLRLLRKTESRRYAIFLGPTALFEWTEDDRATRRLVPAQLVNARVATRVEVARVWAARQYGQSHRPAGGG
jgi:hypothetical protein